jgi:hypothetical protein
MRHVKLKKKSNFEVDSTSDSVALIYPTYNYSQNNSYLRLHFYSGQRRQSYLTEMQRLKETGQLDPPGHGTKGSLTISDIRLPLKKDFVTKIGTT